VTTRTGGRSIPAGELRRPAIHPDERGSVTQGAVMQGLEVTYKVLACILMAAAILWFLGANLHIL
jgi:hypothetical protein